MNEERHSPQEQPGKLASLTLTIVVHVGLALFLFFGVNWQSKPPASLEVELVSAPSSRAPQAQPTPEPRPEPPKPEPKPEPKPVVKQVQPPAPPKPVIKPEIATKAPEKKPEPPKPEPKPETKKPEPKKPDPPKPEPKKPEPPKPEPKKPEPKPEPEPEPKKPEPKVEPKKPEPPKPVVPPKDNYMAKLLEQESDRAKVEGMMRGEAARAASARTKGEIDAYQNAIRTKVRGNLLSPPGLSGNPEAVFEVDQLPSGEVLVIRLKRSSGIPALDDAIERAIRRSSPLPLPTQRELFQRTLELKFRPLDE